MSDKLTIEKVVSTLDKMDSDDPEMAHHEADCLLLDFISEMHGPEIERAYERLIRRCKWWSPA